MSIGEWEYKDERIRIKWENKNEQKMMIRQMRQKGRMRIRIKWENRYEKMTIREMRQEKEEWDWDKKKEEWE